MTAPWDQQTALAAILTDAGLPTSAEVPARFTPPARYVLASGPWLAGGQKYGSWRARFRVVCVTATGTNARQMDELGGMVRAVVLALRGTRFTVEAEAVDEPSEIATGSGVSLGAVINVSVALSRAEFEEE